MLRCIKHLELFSETCDSELKRIKDLKAFSNNRIDSIKRYLTPYIIERGKMDVSTFKLSNRVSEKVILEDGFKNLDYALEQKYKPDKTRIKKDLKSGVDVEGASLKKFDNLQIR